MMADPKDRSAFFKNQGKDVNVSSGYTITIPSIPTLPVATLLPPDPPNLRTLNAVWLSIRTRVFK